tara:strand:- start:315 stop:482 length:168 start_codon:yes stop_codon:yes gene_type:complete
VAVMGLYGLIAGKKYLSGMGFSLFSIILFVFIYKKGNRYISPNEIFYGCFAALFI